MLTTSYLVGCIFQIRKLTSKGVFLLFREVDDKASGLSTAKSTSFKSFQMPKELGPEKKNQIIVFYVKLGGTSNIVTQCLLYSEIIFTLPAIEPSGTVAVDVAVEDFLPNKKKN